uniref:Serine-threonine/tyrosine-protein kinase catalytic domain-containing protein n=1 Tax=Glossina pallidipes TaxID=7398 RepID=A0A1A9Z5N6_GLOPL
MGEKPESPGNLSQEGPDFIDHCLQHDPKDRMTLELLENNFCKFGREEDFSTEESKDPERRSFHRYNVI